MYDENKYDKDGARAEAIREILQGINFSFVREASDEDLYPFTLFREALYYPVTGCTITSSRNLMEVPTFEEGTLYSTILSSGMFGYDYFGTETEEGMRALSGAFSFILDVLYGDYLERATRNSRKVHPTNLNSDGFFPGILRGSEVQKVTKEFCILSLSRDGHPPVLFMMRSAMVSNFIPKKWMNALTVLNPSWVQRTFFKEGVYSGPDTWPFSLVVTGAGIVSLGNLTYALGSLLLGYTPDLVEAPRLTLVGKTLTIYEVPKLRNLPNLVSCLLLSLRRSVLTLEEEGNFQVELYVRVDGGSRSSNISQDFEYDHARNIVLKAYEEDFPTAALDLKTTPWETTHYIMSQRLQGELL
jgi:hypothetical protein